MSAPARALVLVAGPPGTGKSRLCDRILRRFPDCVSVSIDTIKEELWDTRGFSSAAQKAALDDEALRRYFAALGTAMTGSRLVLSDYPFSDKQRPTLAALCEQHAFTPVTLRLSADLDVLYERQRRRDLDPSRHPGHLLDHYHRGDVIAERSEATGLLSQEEFVERCTTRGYDTFRLGDLLEVDTTDLDRVDEEAILSWLGARIARPTG